VFCCASVCCPSSCMLRCCACALTPRERCCSAALRLSSACSCSVGISPTADCLPLRFASLTCAPGAAVAVRCCCCVVVALAVAAEVPAPGSGVGPRREAIMGLCAVAAAARPVSAPHKRDGGWPTNGREDPAADLPRSVLIAIAEPLGARVLLWRWQRPNGDALIRLGSGSAEPQRGCSMAMAEPLRGCAYTLCGGEKKNLRCGSVLCAALVRASCKLSARSCSPTRNSPDERRSVDQKCHKPPGW
jgi:hypothetical protein